MMGENCSSSNIGSRIQRGHWRPEEDEKLRQLVLTNGARNWNTISESVEGRTGKSCRLRWFNQLNPMIKKGPFSKEEEDRLIEAHNIYGNKWSTIASLFPGRTDNALKNHFHVVTARKRREEMKSPGHVGALCWSQKPCDANSHLRYPAAFSSSRNDAVQASSDSSSFGFSGMRIGANGAMVNDEYVLNKPNDSSLNSLMVCGSNNYHSAGFLDRRGSPSKENFLTGKGGEGSSSVHRDEPDFIDFLGVGDPQ